MNTSGRNLEFHEGLRGAHQPGEWLFKNECRGDAVQCGRMRAATNLIGLGLVVALAGCAADDREWMKINEKYTTEDFRRDYAACSKSGKLDEECMKHRGWVAVTAPKQADKPYGDPYGRDVGPRIR